MHKQKTFIALLLALLLATGSGCAAPKQDAPAEQTELIVFAAASMTETLTEIASLYGAVNPQVELVFNFDSSGTLKTQIQEGADCDLFLSAGQKQMDQLDAAADPAVNTEGLDLLLAGSRMTVPGGATSTTSCRFSWRLIRH